MRRFKNKKAQQLVEFLLVAPFLVIILGIVTEYAYALNVNMTLALGVKTVSADIYKKIKPNFTSLQIQKAVYDGLKQYLSNNNVPVQDANGVDTVDLQALTVGDNVIFLASLRYYPAFTLPNTYFKILPEQFNFTASAVVPAAFLADTTAYRMTTADLLGINGPKSGIMNKWDYRWNTLFVVSTSDYTNINAVNGDGYLLKDWDGQAVTGDNGVLVLKKGTGTLYDCSSTTSCTVYWSNFADYFLNRYGMAIFVHDSSSTWLSPAGEADLSPKTVSGVLKRALALTNGSDMSVGNYDNTKVILYNALFPTITYKTIAVGTAVVAYDETEDAAAVNQLINP